MRKVCATLVVGLMMFGGAFFAFAEDKGSDEVNMLGKTSKAFVSIAKRTMPAVVYVEVKTVVGVARRYGWGPNADDPFGGLFGKRNYDSYRIVPYEMSGVGSGFIISKDGYILTNHHIVGDADSIRVKLNDGREYDAKRIGSDVKSDIAVIKIEGQNFPFIELGDSTALEIGEWVIAIGNPMGLSHTLTVGVVSAKGRNNLGIAEYEDFIQTDAAINQGNSGGPLLNIEGKAIGINSAIISQTGSYAGIGLAVPINMAKVIKDQLIKSGKVVRGYIGVQLDPQEMTKVLAESHMLKKPVGVVITEVSNESPASAAGLVAGDVVVNINGREMDSLSTFRNTIAVLQPGVKAQFSVMREGKERKIDVVIGAYPDASAPLAGGSRNMDRIGFSVRDLTPEIARQLNYGDSEGVVIDGVDPDSPAAEAGLEEGLVVVSVNRTAVRNSQEFNQVIKSLKNGKRILMQVRNQHYSWFVPLHL